MDNDPSKASTAILTSVNSVFASLNLYIYNNTCIYNGHRAHYLQSHLTDYLAKFVDDL